MGTRLESLSSYKKIFKLPPLLVKSHYLLPESIVIPLRGFDKPFYSFKVSGIFLDYNNY
jgi:hypothetical protein